MLSLYHQVCHQCSELVTKRYSTSFSSAINLLHKDLRQPIYDIYGFVRFADEIVDTFHHQDKAVLLDAFSNDTWKAIKLQFSIHPIIHSFQAVVRRYSIPDHLIAAFLRSMEMDLYKTEYGDRKELDEYVYGSAEVVGLMCLCVFVDGDEQRYASLEPSARKLGAAFQKVNFLRDIQADHHNLNRAYFPGFDFRNFTDTMKSEIEMDIEQDFQDSLPGIRSLPWKARFGVYTAYKYYYTLFKKIRKIKPKSILESRVRVPDYQKVMIMMQAKMAHNLNII